MNIEFKTGDHVLIRSSSISGFIVAKERPGVFLIKNDSDSRESFTVEENDLVLLKAGNELTDLMFNLKIRKLNRYLKKNYKAPVIEPESKNDSDSEKSYLESSEKNTEGTKKEEPDQDRKHRSAFEALTSFFRKLAFWIKSDEEDDNAEPDVSDETADQHVPEILFDQNIFGSSGDCTTVLHDPESSDAEPPEMDLFSGPGVFGGTAGSLFDDVPETTEVRPLGHVISESAADAVSEADMEAPALPLPFALPLTKPSKDEASEHNSIEAPEPDRPRPSAYFDREYHSFETFEMPSPAPAVDSIPKPVIHGAPAVQDKNDRRYDSVRDGYPLKGLEGLIKNRPESFQTMLFRLIDSSGKTDSEIYTKANIDRRYFSKIRSGNIPRRSTVMALCLALHLDTDVAADLMNKAGYGFSDANITDLIVVFCLQERIFELDTVNDILHRYKEDYLRV